MNPVPISILSFLFIFAMAPYAGCDSDQSVRDGTHRIRTMKMDVNRDAFRQKKNSKLSPTKRSPAPVGKLEGKTAPAVIKRDMDFLKGVEEKKRAEWIYRDHGLDSREFSQRCARELFASGGVHDTRFFNAGFDDAPHQPLSTSRQYFVGATKLEALKHLDPRKEERLREIFMGLRFSFAPTSRHMVLEMNLNHPFSENRGLTIPF